MVVEMSDPRVTMHNGRAGKDGAYSSRHDDRNFDLKNAQHIDPARIAGNRYWHCYQHYDPGMTFKQAEIAFYEQNFGFYLDERNRRVTEQRHPERVRTMDEYRTAARTCPEETIYQIGKAGQTVDPDTLWQVVMQQINWERKTYPNVRLLDVALHVDEQGAPHVHARKVWVAHENRFTVKVGQAQALAEMGIKPPDESKPYGRHNNAKMTYTRDCREHLIEVCREHGIEIETQPLEHSKTGLSLEEYKARQEIDRADRARQDAKQAKEQLAAAAAQTAREHDKADRIHEETGRILQQAEERHKELTEHNEKLRQAEERVREAAPTVEKGAFGVLRVKGGNITPEELSYAIGAINAQEGPLEVIADADRQARQIIYDAQEQAREIKSQSVRRQLEEIPARHELDRIRADMPELFDSAGKYRGRKQAPGKGQIQRDNRDDRGRF